LNAKGFGTVTAQEKVSQNVSGWGIWQEGKWKVVFVRSLESEDERDAAFTTGRPVPFAVAVWDGSSGDRAAQKAVSNWYRLILERR
jgi:DMSO reductase family type II enzyme heme b subunit